MISKRQQGGRRPLRAVLAAVAMLGGCSTGPAVVEPDAHAASRPRLSVELLALDVTTCGRCTGTEANLEGALRSVAAVLRDADVDVQVTTTVVSSAAQAQALRFASSPTIRVNGRDLALELRESACGDCTTLCGSEGSVDCRVWIWRGEEYTEAPKALIVDAILRSYARAWEPLAPASEPFALPDNLRRFFEARSNAESTRR